MKKKQLADRSSFFQSNVFKVKFLGIKFLEYFGKVLDEYFDKVFANILVFAHKCFLDARADQTKENEATADEEGLQDAQEGTGE